MEYRFNICEKHVIFEMASKLKFDEISSDYVKINGIKHIPYPGNCHCARNIYKCDYRSHEGYHDINHDVCDLGFNGYNTTCDENLPCIYADKPDMCPNFTVSCLDCKSLGSCEHDMYFVALTCDTSQLDLERQTHHLYRK